MYKNMFDLTDKVAVLTGGAGGLGREVAKGLAEFGADVVLASRRIEALEEAAEEVRSLGRKAIAIKTDVTDYESVKNMTREVMNQFDKIDILINAAGINNRIPLLELPVEEWDKIINVNLRGTFLCCKCVGEIMVKQNRGKVINFGSVSSILGHPNHSAYAASKGGVLLLTRVLAMEWAKHNVNINCIGPAYIETPLTSDYLHKGGHYEKVAQTIPLGRLGTPHDIVGATVYLASSASDFVTGTILMVDGGRTAD